MVEKNPEYLIMLFDVKGPTFRHKIYDEYKSGKLLTGELKAILIEKINGFLKVHQEKREKARDQVDKFLFENK